MILVTGATGFLGKRVCLALEKRGVAYQSISRSLGLDIRDIEATKLFFQKIKPSYVINCAAYVGGIQFGYKRSAEIFHNNLLMTISLLEAAWVSGVKKIVNPISNCAYPSESTLFKEENFWNGPLHESVLAYGFARKASWVGSWAYRNQYGLDVLNLILSNMYGPQDHFEEERSHALGAIIMKIVRAHREGLKEVVIWGSGKPVREWLHVDDGAEAMIRGLAARSTSEPINIGVSKGISIIDLAMLVKDLVGYTGNLVLDLSKQDGAPFKTVDGKKGFELLGWQPSRSFKKSIKETIDWYRVYGKNY